MKFLQKLPKNLQKLQNSQDSTINIQISNGTRIVQIIVHFSISQCILIEFNFEQFFSATNFVHFKLIIQFSFSVFVAILIVLFTFFFPGREESTAHHKYLA
jgi:hypothetical protein